MPRYGRVLSIAAGTLMLVFSGCKDEPKKAATTDGGATVDRGAIADGVAQGEDRGTASDGATGGEDRGTASDGGGQVDANLPPQCSGATLSTVAAGPTPSPAPAVTLPQGFAIESIASIPTPRQLAALPNGDLVVGTKGQAVYLIPNAEADGQPGAPVVFSTVDDAPVQGVAFARSICTIYVASRHGIYATPYVDAQTTATLGEPIAKVRQINDTGHSTTSVVFAGGTLYAGVGSSCDACVEIDPTRATIQRLDPDGANMSTRATRFRNAIALAVNPATGTVWAGGAGQDSLALGHPYEFFDALTLHAGTADYGWPACEENQHAYIAGSDCSQTVVPRIEMPAYSTIIGAVFYPSAQTGKHAFPEAYRGGVFLSVHGAWHTSDGAYYSPPRVAYVAMTGDTPQVPIDWSDPSKQWTEFVGGFQLGTTRIGRPTGIAVGREGSLFLADDQSGRVYRIRPN